MSNKIKLGWGRRDVTPPRPCLIGGQMYMRISADVLDPIMTTALTIENGEDMVIFVSLDAVVCRGRILDRVKAKLSERRPDIDGQKVLMSATHSHTTPQLSSNPEVEELVPPEAGNVMFGDEMADYTAEKITEAIIESFDGRAEGGFAYGYGFATVGHSRRTLYSRDLSVGAPNDSMHSVNGFCQMYGNTNDVDFVGYEKGTESFLNALFTYDAEGKLTGMIANVPCPSQCSEQRSALSADYWHDVRVAVKERFGDVYVLSQCAAAGDLSPRQLHYNDAEQRRFNLKYGEGTDIDMGRRRDIAERIVAGLAEIEAWASKDIKTEAVLKHTVIEVNLAKQMISERQYQESLEGIVGAKAVVPKLKGEWYEDFKRKTRRLTGIARYAEIIESYEAQQTQPTVTTESHIIRLGDIAFASNRFELFMDYEQRIQARSPAQQTFIVQLAAQPGPGGGTYLPTANAKANKGYSASIFDGDVDASGGPVLVEETLKKLNEIFAE